MTNFNFYIQYNLCTLHIPEANLLIYYDHGTPLCDTCQVEDMPLCDIPDGLKLTGFFVVCKF